MTRRFQIVILRGFTLLELLVVLAIAGLLLTVVPPMISAVLPGTELKTAARELVLSLRQARLDAISHGTIVDVKFAGNPARYAIGDSPFELLPDETELRIRHLGDAELLVEPHRLRFSPDGSSSGTSLLLSRDKYHYAVSVGWLMGRVTVNSEVSNDF